MSKANDMLKAAITGSNVSVAVPVGETLQFALTLSGINPNTECGGLGVCGQCRVQFNADSAPAPNFEESYLISEEELAKGWRLACQTIPEQDCRITIPKTDATPGIQVLTNAHISEGQSLGVNAADLRFQKGLGFAIDVGTTTVACYLIDLANGKQIDVAAFANPQRKFGADVISRIQYAHQGESKLQELQQCIVSSIEEHLLSLCHQHEINPAAISHMTAVGNSTMMHLLWGVDPWSLGVAPYQPVFTEKPTCNAENLGFKRFPNMTAELLPGIASHLGADTVAGILTLNTAHSQGATLFLDLGTNGEIVLFSGDHAVGCSCAAGPAFEGVHISSGTPAINGAIDHIDIGDRDLVISTIGDQEPLGLCGSGLVDCITNLIKAGILSVSGRFNKPKQLPDSLPPALKQRVQVSGKRIKYILHQNSDGTTIALTQADVREVQFAKAAFRTGIEFLLKELSLSYDDVAHVYVGGGFGSHLRMENLVALGVVPETMRDIIEPVGNVAGLGAKLALVSQSKRAKSQEVSRWIGNIFLESQENFSDIYTKHLSFPAPANGQTEGKRT